MFLQDSVLLCAYTTYLNGVAEMSKSKMSGGEIDKREVYKDKNVVDTYDRRLYYGLSRGLFYQREVSLFYDFFPAKG